MSEPKFRLTDETKVNAQGVTLHLIEATSSFGDVKNGDKGGWVEKEDNLSQDGNAWVDGNAQVCGNAMVLGDALVYGNALIYGNARIYGSARVNGEAKVYGSAIIRGNARVSGNAMVSDNAFVYGNAIVCGNARVSDYADVCGDAEVYGNARVQGYAWVHGNATLSLKKAYTKGRFIYSYDRDMVATVVDQSEDDGFNCDRDYENILVLGDYEIKDVEDEPTRKAEPETIELNGKKYQLIEEV